MVVHLSLLIWYLTVIECRIETQYHYFCKKKVERRKRKVEEGREREKNHQHPMWCTHQTRAPATLPILKIPKRAFEWCYRDICATNSDPGTFFSMFATWWGTSAYEAIFR